MLVLVDVWLHSVKQLVQGTGRQIIVDIEYFDATSITRGRSKTFRFQGYILLYFLTVSFKLRFFWIMLVQIDRWDRLNNSEIPKKPSIVHCMHKTSKPQLLFNKRTTTTTTDLLTRYQNTASKMSSVRTRNPLEIK